MSGGAREEIDCGKEWGEESGEMQQLERRGEADDNQGGEVEVERR